jgi:hypothetical protein
LKDHSFLLTSGVSDFVNLIHRLDISISPESIGDREIERGVIRASAMNRPAAKTFELKYECDGEAVGTVTGRTIDRPLNHLVVRTHTVPVPVFFSDFGSFDGIKILPVRSMLSSATWAISSRRSARLSGTSLSSNAAR